MSKGLLELDGTDPQGAVSRLQKASLAECEDLLAGRGIADLSPLVREALLLRLSELDPARIAELLLAEDGGNFATWSHWIGWLSQAHPDLLKKQIAAGPVSISRREALEGAVLDALHRKGVDPRSLLDRVLKSGGETHRIPAALNRLADEDPHLALDYLSRLLKDGTAFFGQDARFLIKLAEADPARLQSLLGLTKTPELQMSMAGSLARVLAKDDPAAAVALYGSMPPSRARSVAAMEIASVWSKHDPDAALAWVQSALPEGPARRAALAVALRSFAASDPARVLELLGPAGADSASLSGYVTNNGSHSFGGDSEGGFDSPDDIRELAMLALVARDPGEALRHLDREAAMLTAEAPDPAALVRHQELLAKTAGSWMAQDPVAAIAWLDRLDPEKRGFLNLSEWSGALEALTPARALESLQAVARMESEEVSGTVLRSLLPVLVNADPAAAFRAAEDLPDHLQTAWLTDAISRLSSIDPLAAAREIDRLPDESRPEAHGKVAAGIAATSPSGAINYLDALPLEEVTALAYRDSMAAWSAGQWEDARTWWQGLPAEASAARDGALASISGKLYEADPTSVAGLVDQIATISDQNLRLTALSNLLRPMAKDNHDAALEWANKLTKDLPAHHAATLQQQVESARREGGR